MHTLTTDDLARDPQRLLADAQRGEASLVMQGGSAVMLAVPLGKALESAELRLELAARLYDAEQISLGLAASMAGLPYSAMIDALGQRGIATIRTPPEELERELAAFER